MLNPITSQSITSSNAIQHPLWTLNNAEDNQNTQRNIWWNKSQYDFNDNLNIQ